MTQTAECASGREVIFPCLMFNSLFCLLSLTSCCIKMKKKKLLPSNNKILSWTMHRNGNENDKENFAPVK